MLGVFSSVKSELPPQFGWDFASVCDRNKLIASLFCCSFELCSFDFDDVRLEMWSPYFLIHLSIKLDSAWHRSSCCTTFTWHFQKDVRSELIQNWTKNPSPARQGKSSICTMMGLAPQEKQMQCHILMLPVVSVVVVVVSVVVVVVVVFVIIYLLASAHTPVACFSDS